MQTYCRQAILSFSLKKEFPYKTGYRSYPSDIHRLPMWECGNVQPLGSLKPTSFSQRRLSFHEAAPARCVGLLWSFLACLLTEYENTMQVHCKIGVQTSPFNPSRGFQLRYFNSKLMAGWGVVRLITLVMFLHVPRAGGSWESWSVCGQNCQKECWCSGYPIGTRWLKRFRVPARSSYKIFSLFLLKYNVTWNAAWDVFRVIISRWELLPYLC